MAQRNPMSVEFSANVGIVPGKVLVSATGKNNTGGYVTSLEQDPREIFPPHARLRNEAPIGMVTEAVTRFETETVELTMRDGQTHVTVHMPEGGTVEIPIG